MIFSVWDNVEKKYFYYASRSPFRIDFTGFYEHPHVPTPWQDAHISVPNDAAPVGSGLEPRGILAHPEEIKEPLCQDEKMGAAALVWAGILWGVKKIIFG